MRCGTTFSYRICDILSSCREHWAQVDWGQRGCGGHCFESFPRTIHTFFCCQTSRRSRKPKRAPIRTTPGGSVEQFTSNNVRVFAEDIYNTNDSRGEHTATTTSDSHAADIFDSPLHRPGSVVGDQGTAVTNGEIERVRATTTTAPNRGRPTRPPVFSEETHEHKDNNEIAGHTARCLLQQWRDPNAGSTTPSAEEHFEADFSWRKIELGAPCGHQNPNPTTRA